MTRRSQLLLAALAVVSTGCYHVTVVSGAPAGAQTIDKPWQHSFVYGLVPPAEVPTRDPCAQGVAKVETERSFVNGLVSLLTWSIYTPVHVTVTCASGPVPR
jgi:hypothetical protein